MLLFKLFSRKSFLPRDDGQSVGDEVGAGFNQIRRCRHGLMVFNQNDQYVGRSLKLYGEFSEGEAQVFDHFLKEGDTVIEVGANIGAHTVHLASLVGPQGLVIAFEPQRLVFQALCANLAINSISNVYAFNSAVGRSQGSIIVPELDPNSFQNFGGFSVQGHTSGIEVPVQTIDGMSLASCNLIKVDVEGMEEEVLAGAVDTIAKFRPVLYVENDRREKSPSLIRFIRDRLGYRMWWHTPPLYNPENFADNADNVFGGIVSGNMLCLPQENPTDLPLREVRDPEEWLLGG